MSFIEKVKPLWDAELLDNIFADSVMAGLVSTTYANKFKTEGSDTVHINAMKNLALQDYNGGNIIPQSLEIVGQDFNLSQYKYMAFEIGKVEQIQTHLKMLPMAKKVVQNMARLAMDTYLLGSQADVLSTYTIGTTGSPIALAKTNIYDYFVDLANALALTGAFDSNERGSVIIHPNHLAMLRKSDAFTHATASGDKVIANGKVGTVADLDIYSTRNNVAISSKYHILAFVKSAIQFAVQIEDTSMCENPFGFGNMYKNLWVYGRKSPTFIDGTSTDRTKMAKIISST